MHPSDGVKIKKQTPASAAHPLIVTAADTNPCPPRSHRRANSHGDKPVCAIVRLLDAVAGPVKGSGNRAMAGLRDVFEDFTSVTFVKAPGDIGLSDDAA